MSAPVLDRVFVRGLEFEGNHGHTAAERRGTRRFRVNVTVEAEVDPAVASDRLADTVDYAALCRLLVDLGTRSTYKLLEALAGAMIREIQRLYPRASVTLELEKLAPPCAGVPASCGVVLTRQAKPSA